MILRNLALTASLAAALLAPVLAQPAPAQTPAKQLFGAAAQPSPHRAGAHGSYARGCVAGAIPLAETGPTWQAMRLSRNRNWGHPEMIAYLGRLSRAAAQLPGWSGLYVGDISQPRGGPMVTGHASHQMGLDADIWLRPATDLSLSRAAREEIGSPSLQRAGGAYVNGGWTPQHHALLRAAASDPAVARIFIFAGAKAQMCRDERGDRSWLRKVRPWWGHDSHFHVRLACPAGSAGCENQPAVPPGDGCAEAERWVQDILDPPPPDPNAKPPAKKRDLVLADLPAACATVLSAR